MSTAYLDKVLKAREAGTRLAVATVVHANGGPAAVGARLYVYEDRTEGTLGDPALDRLVTADARILLAGGESRSYLYRWPSGGESPCGPGRDGGDGRDAVVRDRRDVVERRDEPGSVQVWIESVVPPPVLVVFGAGHDAIPVTELGARAGFRVVVVDSRPAYARPERFPRAHRVVHAHPEDVPAHVTIDAHTFVVVMTHNFNHDTAILERIWGLPYRYLGVLGPWERTERILDFLRSQGRPVDAHLDRLYAPIGLDIGAEGPEQIAVAIVAEVLAVRRGAPGGFLRFRTGPLHEAHRRVRP